MHQIMHIIEMIAFLVLGVSISGSVKAYNKFNTFVAVFSLTMLAYSTFLDRPIFLVIIIITISIRLFDEWMVHRFGKKIGDIDLSTKKLPSDNSIRTSHRNVPSIRSRVLRRDSILRCAIVHPVGGILLGAVCGATLVWIGIEKPGGWLLDVILHVRPGHANFYLLPPIIFCSLYGLWVLNRLLWGALLETEIEQCLRWVTLGVVIGLYGALTFISDFHILLSIIIEPRFIIILFYIFIFVTLFILLIRPDLNFGGRYSIKKEISGELLVGSEKCRATNEVPKDAHRLKMTEFPTKLPDYCTMYSRPISELYHNAEHVNLRNGRHSTAAKKERISAVSRPKLTDKS